MVLKKQTRYTEESEILRFLTREKEKKTERGHIYLNLKYF